MKFKVVQTYDIGAIYDEDSFKKIGAEIVKKFGKTEEEIIAAAHDADAIITLSNRQAFPKSIIDKLDKCRIIASVGIGFEKIDVKAAAEHGILVTNVPDANVPEVSDHTMALLLALARKLFPLDRAVRDGKFDTPAKLQIMKFASPMSRLDGQILGMVGFGKIPRTLVPKARGFGLKMIAYDPFLPKGINTEYGVELVELDRVLRESDYVSMHANVTEQNQHMMNAEQFRKMKPTAYFINTSRGALVDEKALAVALTEGWIAGAALDVVEPEPPSLDNPLFKAPNLIITPHLAGFSDTAQAEGLKRPAQEVLRVFNGEWPKGLVNPEAKEKYQARWHTKA